MVHEPINRTILTLLDEFTIQALRGFSPPLHATVNKRAEHWQLMALPETGNNEVNKFGRILKGINSLRRNGWICQQPVCKCIETKIN